MMCSASHSCLILIVFFGCCGATLMLRRRPSVLWLFTLVPTKPHKVAFRRWNGGRGCARCCRGATSVASEVAEVGWASDCFTTVYCGVSKRNAATVSHRRPGTTHSVVTSCIRSVVNPAANHCSKRMCCSPTQLHSMDQWVSSFPRDRGAELSDKRCNAQPRARQGTADH